MKKYYRMLSGVTLGMLLLLLVSEHMDTIRSGIQTSGSSEKAAEKILVFCSAKDKGMVFQNFYQGLEDGNENLHGNIDISIYERRSSETMSQEEYELRIAQAIQPDYMLITSRDTSLLNAGIPYFLYDGDMEDSERLAYVGTENHQAGYLAGQEAASLIPEEEVHAAIIMLLDNDVFQERAEGFQDAFSQSERLHVEEIYNIKGDFSVCRNYIANLLENTEEDGAINLIFCEDSVVSAVVAEQICKNDDYQNVKIIGMDLNDYTLPYLENGCIQAVIDQNYYQAGLDLMELIIHKEKYTFPITVYHDCQVIKAEDLI